MASLDEPLCERTLDRFILFPLRLPQVYDAYKRAQTTLWSAEEIDLNDDVRDWNTLTADERHFLAYTLAFFAGADLLVNENIQGNLWEEITSPEVRMFYALQMYQEAVHTETYSLLLQTLIADVRERDSMFAAVRHMPGVKEKAEWALRWRDSRTATLAERLVAFVVVEGISFSASFCSIFYFKKRGLMPGVTFSNELISRDEGLHWQFGALLHGLLKEPCTEAEIHTIVRSAVDVERIFVTKAIPVSLIGMNSTLMMQYVEFVANVVCTALHVGPAYPGVMNPFDWMELSCFNGKTNFFERRVSEYAKSNTEVRPKVVTLNADF